MIPTSTGAAKAIGLVMPELKGKCTPSGASSHSQRLSRGRDL